MIRTDFHESGVCVIAPESARLTAAVAGTFRDEATRIIESGHSRLVIDLSDVSFVDSSGLGALVALLKRVGNRGEIVVCGVGEAVAEHAPGARTILFGHLGDGNVHVNVLGPDPADDAVDVAVLELAAACGGTISAEHGVGVAKAAHLGLVRGEGELAAMRAIKRALDPGGMLNPGVVLED